MKPSRGCQIPTFVSWEDDQFCGPEHRRAQVGGLEVSTVNSSLRVLRRVLRQAGEWGLLQTVPKIKMVPGERHRERVLGIEEKARYLAAASEPPCVANSAPFRPFPQVIVSQRSRWHSSGRISVSASTVATDANEEAAQERSQAREDSSLCALQPSTYLSDQTWRKRV